MSLVLLLVQRQVHLVERLARLARRLRVLQDFQPPLRAWLVCLLKHCARLGFTDEYGKPGPAEILH